MMFLPDRWVVLLPGAAHASITCHACSGLSACAGIQDAFDCR